MLFHFYRFEAINTHIFAEIKRSLEEFVNSAKLRGSRINEILMVGGSARIPKIKTIIQNMFRGIPLVRSNLADSVVPHGAGNVI